MPRKGLDTESWDSLIMIPSPLTIITKQINPSCASEQAGSQCSNAWDRGGARWSHQILLLPFWPPLSLCLVSLLPNDSWNLFVWMRRLRPCEGAGGQTPVWRLVGLARVRQVLSGYCFSQHVLRPAVHPLSWLGLIAAFLRKIYYGMLGGFFGTVWVIS